MKNQARDPSVTSPAPAAREAHRVPLAVDLDGTLVRSDMLMESLASALKRAPWLVLALPFWLLGGRARLKSELARRADLDVTLLPYDENVLAQLRRARSAGHPLVLATAADEGI